MHKSRLLFVLIAVFLTSASWAQETDPSHDISKQWAAEQTRRVENQARLNELIGTMTEEMATIRATTNREERGALMTAHREHMREALGLMRSLGGTHLHEVVSEHAGPGMEVGDAQRLDDLENRLDMMLVMMESVIENGTN